MPAHHLEINSQRAGIRAREAKEFRVMYLATFPLFLAAAVVTRGASWRRVPVARESVFAEARAAANTCLPFAFMR